MRTLFAAITLLLMSCAPLRESARDYPMLRVTNYGDGTARLYINGSPAGRRVESGKTACLPVRAIGTVAVRVERLGETMRFPFSADHRRVWDLSLGRFLVTSLSPVPGSGC